MNWIRETSIARFQNIQILFNLLNVGVVLFAGTKLLQETQRRFSATPASAGLFASFPVALGVIGITSATVYLLNRFLSDQPEPPERIGQVEMSEKMSFDQKGAQVLQIAKLVISVGLLFFSKHQFWLAFSIATDGYSLFKNKALKWLTFSRSFPIISPNPQVPVIALKATYKVLVLPFDQLAAAKDQCAICLDDSQDVNMTFCANHLFHKDCVADLAVSKSDSFVNNPAITKTATRHYSNGVYTHTTYGYKIGVSQNNFPACPICRDIPLQNECEIEVTDQLHGKINASVTIRRPPKDHQHQFETLYAIYNVAQAALAYLQTYSEMAGVIFTIQKVMLVFDVVGYLTTTYYLYKHLNVKLNPQDSLAIKLSIVAALVATAAVSYFVMLQINAYLRSALVLKEILAKLDISPEILNTISISWNSPLTHKLMQCLYVNRIVSLVALSFFSNQWKTNLLSITAQMGSLIGISRLMWIEMTQTLQWPLEKVVAAGGHLLGYLHERSLQSLSFTSHFIIDRACASNAVHLQTTLQSIYNFTVNFFNDSTWYHYWQVTYQYGIETGRKLVYEISLQNYPVQPCGCNLIPTLTGYTIKVHDAALGAAKVVTLGR